MDKCTERKKQWGVGFAELPEESKRVLIRWGCKILLRELERRKEQSKDKDQ